MNGDTSSAIFEQINGREFASYRLLEQHIVELFNKHLSEFPPHYTYRHVLEWGERHRWIEPIHGVGVRIAYKPVPGRHPVTGGTAAGAVADAAVFQP